MDSNAVERSSWNEEDEEALQIMLDSLTGNEETSGVHTTIMDVPSLQEADPKPRIGSNIRGTANQKKRKTNPSSPPAAAQPWGSNINGTENQKKMKSNPTSPASSQESLKASNLGMSQITIGDWQRHSKREGDLVAKLYFKGRRLIWEILHGQLKRKMEISWSHITAIKAVMAENQPGILKIELSEPPSFHQEIPPQPKQHTKWQVYHDFTEGQALLHRRHIATFPSGVLDEYYEKLLYDEHLFALSHKPFPNEEERPQFDIGTSSNVSELSINFNGPVGPQQYPRQVNGLMAQQYPSQVNFDGPILIQPYPSQVHFNEQMAQQCPYQFPPANVAIAGNQFINTPNRNGGGNGQLNQFINTPNRSGGAGNRVWNAERILPPPRANPSLHYAEGILVPPPRANPSPQPPSCYNHLQFIPGHNYPLNNLVLPNNPEMQESEFYENVTRFLQLQQDQVMMLQNNGPSVRPSPVVLQMGTEDDTSFRSNDEGTENDTSFGSDLRSILRNSIVKQKPKQEGREANGGKKNKG